jgi:hypothetical protein
MSFAGVVPLYPFSGTALVRMPGCRWSLVLPLVVRLRVSGELCTWTPGIRPDSQTNAVCSPHG